MNRMLICLVASISLLAAAGAGAEEGKKLYRWVDKDGKVQFSDALPPEAVDQARTEINSRNARVLADVDRALSAEERAAKQQADRDAAVRAAAEEKARMSEEAMLASFQTEDDLRRAFQIRVELLQQTLNAIEAGIASQRSSLSGLLAQASEAELAGRAVPLRHKETIGELHDEIGKQQQMLVVKQAELVELDSELEHLVARFHELRDDDRGDVGGAAPATTPPAAAADAETPAG